MIVHGAVLASRENRAPFAEHRPLTVQELELADPGESEVLVAMEAAGLCHSDLSRVNGDRDGVVPLVLGHEGCGRVVAAGRGVRGVEVGDKVAMVFHTRCGECEACRGPRWSLCPRGLASAAAGEPISGGRRLSTGGEELNHHLGVSAFADHAVVDARSVVVIPQEVPSDVGALLGCAILTGGGAATHAGGVTAGDEVAVVGMGGVGLAAAMVAVAVGAHVTVVDPLRSKLDLALGLGVHETLTVDAATGGERRFDVVVEAVGRPQALEMAMDLTGVGGRTVTVGLPPVLAHPRRRGRAGAPDPVADRLLPRLGRPGHRRGRVRPDVPARRPAGGPADLGAHRARRPQRGPRLSQRGRGGPPGRPVRPVSAGPGAPTTTTTRPPRRDP